MPEYFGHWLRRCELWLEQNERVRQTIDWVALMVCLTQLYILTLSTVIFSPSILPVIVTLWPA